MGQLQQTDVANEVLVDGTTGVNEKELRDYFEAYGSVSSVRLAYDSAGKRQGFGFVQFKHAFAAYASLGLQHNIAGRLVTEQPARQKLQDTQTRPDQAQHVATISETANISVTDILCQVPTLPEILTPDSKKALSATCKSCRLQFIAQVQVVTVVCVEDYALVVELRWPRLCMVILQQNCAAPRPSSLTRILDVVVSAKNSMASTTISMLRPLHNPAVGLSFTCMAAQQLAHQMRLKWPLMDMFGYTPHAHGLDGLGLEVVSQLVKGSWTQLVQLHLSECDLEAGGFLILSQGNWPCLQSLDVSGLDAEGMALLVKGNWPKLSSVALSFDCSVDAIPHLMAANWPLDELQISHTLSIGMAAELADLQLPRLTALYLMGSGMTAAAVSELARANWPKLQTLYLVGSGLTAAAVSELARANWPSLHTLNVDHDDLDAVAILFGVDQEKVQQLKSNADDFAVPQPRMSAMAKTDLDQTLQGQLTPHALRSFWPALQTILSCIILLSLDTVPPSPSLN